MCRARVVSQEQRRAAKTQDRASRGGLSPARPLTLRPQDAEKQPDRFLLRDFGRLLGQATLNPNGVRERKREPPELDCACSIRGGATRSGPGHRVSWPGGGCSVSVSGVNKRPFRMWVAVAAVTGAECESPVLYREARQAQTFERPRRDHVHCLVTFRAPHDRLHVRWASREVVTELKILSPSDTVAILKSWPDALLTRLW